MCNIKEQEHTNILNANAKEYLPCTRVINLTLLPSHKSVGHVDAPGLLVFSARTRRISVLMHGYSLQILSNIVAPKL